MKLSYKLNITARFQRMNIKLKGRYSVFPLRTKATSKLQYKKNINPQTAEELAKELEACAEESAKLDEKMLRIRDRIAED